MAVASERVTPIVVLADTEALRAYSLPPEALDDRKPDAIVKFVLAYIRMRDLNGNQVLEPSEWPKAPDSYALADKDRDDRLDLSAPTTPWAGGW